MTKALVEFAQGTVEGFPTYRSQMKHRLLNHFHDRAEHLLRFTLVTDGVELEVELVDTRGHGTPGDGTWYTEMIVCPVATLSTTKKGLRIIHIDVDASGRATYY